MEDDVIIIQLTPAEASTLELLLREAQHSNSKLAELISTKYEVKNVEGHLLQITGKVVESLQWWEVN